MPAAGDPQADFVNQVAERRLAHPRHAQCIEQRGGKYARACANCAAAGLLRFLAVLGRGEVHPVAGDHGSARRWHWLRRLCWRCGSGQRRRTAR